MSSSVELRVGDKAPDFTLKDQGGNDVRLSGIVAERPAVLIFYPGDLTPGCTAQLCGIRDSWDKFAKAGVSVFGVNHGDAQSHKMFIDKYRFPFPLLVDTDKHVSKAYGAIRKFFSATIIRRTVVGIGADGVILFYKHGMPKEADILKSMTRKRI